MPILAHNDHCFALGLCRSDDLIVNMVGNAFVVVVEFLLFTVIDAIRLLLADPLCPTFQDEGAIDALFYVGLIGCADENKVGGVALLGQGFAELCDASA